MKITNLNYHAANIAIEEKEYTVNFLIIFKPKENITAEIVIATLEVSYKNELEKIMKSSNNIADIHNIKFTLLEVLENIQGLCEVIKLLETEILTKT